VLFTVFSKQRAEALKVKLYAELTRELQGALSIPASDVMVCVVENSGADWSFGNGIAQFLTGGLGRVHTKQHSKSFDDERELDEGYKHEVEFFESGEDAPKSF
jgi:hypothetical protein